MSVEEGVTRRGIGSKLVKTGLMEMKKRGFGGYLPIGNHAVYGLIGFRSRKRSYRDSMPEIAQFLPFSDHTPGGEVTFAPTLEVA